MKLAVPQLSEPGRAEFDFAKDAAKRSNLQRLRPMDRYNRLLRASLENVMTPADSHQPESL